LNQRARDHHEHAEDGRDDAPDPREGWRAAATQGRTAHEARGGDREQLRDGEREQGSGDGAPQEREGHDTDRLVLVDIHVIHVDDRDQGHQDGRRHDGDGEEAQQPERDDEDGAAEQRQLEGPDLLARQGGIQRGHDTQRVGALAGCRGIGLADTPRTTPSLLLLERIAASDTPGQVRDDLAALVAADGRGLRIGG
jgi:hypothetical protein